MNQENIGRFISLSRRSKALTQEQLAEKLGVSINAVSKWERGLNLPDVSLMKELCNILDITLNELFEGKKLSDNEIKVQSEKNLMSLILTKKQLQTIQIFTELLIVMGILIAITLRITLTKTTIQKIIVTVIGIFVWAFGLFLRFKIRKALEK